MGIRSRLKGRIKKFAGTTDPVEPLARREAPPREPATTPQRAPTPPPSPAAANTPSPPSAEAKESKPVDDEKIKRHRAKAQRGVLKHLHKEGGTMSMKDLHDYSERRWFIAHAGFSKMMEFFVEDRYVDFDHDTYTVVLTDDGRHFMQSSGT